MYIISKKKDYYDGVAGTTGIDKTIVYHREVIELEEDKLPKQFRRKSNWRKEDINPLRELSTFKLKKEFHDVCEDYSYFIIGFCGKLYIGWKLYREEIFPYMVDTEITFDSEYMKSILEPKSWYNNLEDNINYIQKFDAIQIFRDLKTPVFVFDNDYSRTQLDTKHYSIRNYNPKFFVNPVLKEYQFYKVFESFQAFQEIQMFLGGVLGSGEKNIVEVADKYKITQHGFDKWSFRKMSENGKRTT